MKITLLTVGKTDNRELDAFVKVYTDRIGRYLPFSHEVIPDVRGAGQGDKEVRKRLEGIEILRRLQPGDSVRLLDERGEMLTSRDLATLIEQEMLHSSKRLVLVVGGPYGFSREVYERVPARLSLSRMTFSHQMIRLLIAEQVYRALTIINNEPYHHS